MAMYSLPGYEVAEDQVAAPVTEPAAQGRVYIGDKISDQQLAALPQGARVVTNPETPTADQQAALASRVAAATSGPSRQLVTAPSGGGVTAPDTTEFVRRAFNTLPVAEASKAVDAAESLIARQGYQRDIQGGMAANTALAKWGPMLFKGSSGMAGIERLGGMTPYQQAQNAIQQQRLKLAQQPKVISPNQQAIDKRFQERLAFQREQAAAKAVPTETLRIPIDPANPFSGTKTFKQAQTNAPAARVVAPTVATPAQAQAPQPAPMPTKKEQLVKGQSYQTARGVATWDGERFVK